MKRSTCQDCVCLSKFRDDWVCDEVNQPIEEIEECPEGLDDFLDEEE